MDGNHTNEGVKADFDFAKVWLIQYFLIYNQSIDNNYNPLFSGLFSKAESERVNALLKL